MSKKLTYYEILHVQPDSPLAVIKASYRILMQVCKIHPDRGGDHEHASIVNEAYNVLRSPKRRAEYDKLLAQLQTQPIKYSSNDNRHEQVNRSHAAHANQHAPSTANNKTINISICQHCKTPHGFNHRSDLNAICGKCQRPLFPNNRHSRSYVTNEPNKKNNSVITMLVCPHCETPHGIDQKTDVKARCPSCKKYLFSKEVIDAAEKCQGGGPCLQLACKHCHVPHSIDPRRSPNAICPSCDEPLFSAKKQPTTSPVNNDLTYENIGSVSMRRIERVTKSSTLYYAITKKGHYYRATLRDISPLGLSFYCHEALAIEQIIYITVDDINVSAKVINTHQEHDKMIIGVEFINSDFRTHVGNFLRRSI